MFAEVCFMSIVFDGAAVTTATAWMIFFIDEPMNWL